MEHGSPRLVIHTFRIEVDIICSPSTQNPDSMSGVTVTLRFDSLQTLLPVRGSRRLATRRRRARPPLVPTRVDQRGDRRRSPLFSRNPPPLLGYCPHAGWIPEMRFVCDHCVAFQDLAI